VRLADDYPDMVKLSSWDVFSADTRSVGTCGNSSSHAAADLRTLGGTIRPAVGLGEATVEQPRFP